MILLKAIEDTGLDTEQWIAHCQRRVLSEAGGGVKRTGDGDGPLVGESIVFTGSLQVARREAADMAHIAGAAVEAGVTKKTTLLVVGDQDIAKLNGASKSNKHRKAEQLIEGGQALRILGETDFLMMCDA